MRTVNCCWSYFIVFEALLLSRVKQHVWYRYVTITASYLKSAGRCCIFHCTETKALTRRALWQGCTVSMNKRFTKHYISGGVWSLFVLKPSLNSWTPMEAGRETVSRMFDRLQELTSSNSNHTVDQFGAKTFPRSSGLVSWCGFKLLRGQKAFPAPRLQQWTSGWHTVKGQPKSTVWTPLKTSLTFHPGSTYYVILSGPHTRHSVLFTVAFKMSHPHKKYEQNDKT